MISGKSVELSRDSVIGNGKPSGKTAIWSDLIDRVK